jgi:hypothetical protein
MLPFLSADQVWYCDISKYCGHSPLPGRGKLRGRVPYFGTRVPPAPYLPACFTSTPRCRHRRRCGPPSQRMPALLQMALTRRPRLGFMPSTAHFCPSHRRGIPKEARAGNSIQLTGTLSGAGLKGQIVANVSTEGGPSLTGRIRSNPSRPYDEPDEKSWCRGFQPLLGAASESVASYC